MNSSEHATKNRAYWERISEEYQTRHADFIGRPEPRWGVWQLPEAELQVLGEVAGKDILELGCGAAQWSILLAARGASVTGLDISSAQLAHARRLIAGAGAGVPLVQASAEAVPLRDAAFDVVFCDYGAMTFTDPYLSVAEAARVLRSDGLFAFSHGSPLLDCCWRTEADHVGRTLENDYFSLRRFEDPDGSVSFQLPYGEWIRVFRRHGLLVEDLIEPRPPEGAVSTYRTAEDHAWARRWSAEIIWKLRKTG
ncbi:MAG: class I SAM-dependent methyltransferase [Dehalococcoidia bacterium]